jgi:hypothetical protein
MKNKMLLVFTFFFLLGCNSQKRFIIEVGPSRNISITRNTNGECYIKFGHGLTCNLTNRGYIKSTNKGIFTIVYAPNLQPNIYFIDNYEQVIKVQIDSSCVRVLTPSIGDSLFSNLKKNNACEFYVKSLDIGELPLHGDNSTFKAYRPSISSTNQ